MVVLGGGVVSDERGTPVTLEGPHPLVRDSPSSSQGELFEMGFCLREVTAPVLHRVYQYAW